jgi:hypothetical protein
VTILDSENAPDAPIFIGAYVELLRVQKENKDHRDFMTGFQHGALAGAIAQNV